MSKVNRGNFFKDWSRAIEQIDLKHTPMSKPKLTAAQRAVIQKMKDGAALMRLTPNGCYYLGLKTINFKTGENLLKLGFIHEASNNAVIKYELTATGHAIDL